MLLISIAQFTTNLGKENVCCRRLYFRYLQQETYALYIQNYFGKN